jgi:hypothetical protein
MIDEVLRVLKFRVPFSKNLLSFSLPKTGAHLDHIELRREEFPQPMSQPKSIKLAHTASLML